MMFFSYFMYKVKMIGKDEFVIYLVVVYGVLVFVL